MLFKNISLDVYICDTLSSKSLKPKPNLEKTVRFSIDSYLCVLMTENYSIYFRICSTRANRFVRNDFPCNLCIQFYRVLNLNWSIAIID